MSEPVYGIGPMIAALQAVKDWNALSSEQRRVVVEHCWRIIELESMIDDLDRPAASAGPQKACR
jgi:hypothetical protein